MELKILKERIAETLNLEVVTEKSLITCVNNCIADLLSRGYREFSEAEITTLHDGSPIKDGKLPLKVKLPLNFRRYSYMKIENESSTFAADRISLASESYLGKKDPDGTIRIAFPDGSGGYLFYILDDHAVIDSRYTNKVLKVTLGYQSTLNKIPHNADLDYDIPIREEIEDALVLYGVYFYVNRTGFDPEVSKGYMDRYRYYVEDIMNALNAEDAYQGSTQSISTRSIF